MKKRLLATGLGILLSLSAQAQLTLRYSDHEPLGNMRTRLFNEEFFRAISEESEQRIRIDAHWQGELSAPYDALKKVGTGEIDLAVAVPEYSAKELPLQQLFKSFPLGPTDAAQVDVVRAAYALIPELNAEFDAQNVILIFIGFGYPVGFMSAQPLADLSAIKGQNWRSASFWHLDFLNNAGAKGVRTPWSEEVAAMLGDGRLHGLMVNIDSGLDIGAHKNAPYVLTAPPLWLGHIYPIVMNKERWDQLSNDDKAAILRAAERAYTRTGSIMMQSYRTLLQELQQQGASVRELSAAELQDWAKVSNYQAVQDQWASQQEADGVKNVRAVLAKLRELITPNPQ